MLPRPAWALGAVGLAAALAWVTIELAQSPAEVPPSPTASSSPAWGDASAAPTRPAVARPAPSAPTAPAFAVPPAPARIAMVPITMTAPPRLHVGEQSELVVALGANAADVGEVSFTLQFEPDMLQARAGAPGDGSAAGGDASFSADVAEAADRVRIRSTAAARGPVATGASVAVVQFQAVAAGTSAVTIADVTLKDLAGNPMHAMLSSPRLLVTAESSAGLHGVAPLQAPPATEAVAGD
jgi:hypothetical protein